MERVISEELLIEPVKLAVIDDNEEFGAGVKMLFAKEGVEVHTATDGPEGLELVKQLLPDIVLLDVVMPGMDGIEVCKRIRKIPELTGVYIIMLSGVRIQTDQMSEGLEAGADGYISRPIPNRELLARIRVYIRLKKAEKDLEKSEERFRIAQEMSPDGFTILHPVRNEMGEITDFTWIYENHTIARINGTDPNEVVGKRILDLFPGHRGTTVFESYLHVANTGKPIILEEVYVGEVISRPTWLRIVVISMGEDIAIHSHDITDRKKTQEELHKSEARFRTIFEIASLGIAQIDPTEGRIIFLNPYYEAITGYRMDELLQMTFLELTHPDDREKDWELFTRAARGEIEYKNEKRYVKKDGTIVWVRIHLAFIRDEKANPIRTVAICEDISDRKQAEKALRQSEERYRLLAENTLDVIWVMNTGLEFTYVNPSIQKLTGYTVEEWLGSRLPDHCDEIHLMQMTRFIQQEIAKGPVNQGIVFETEMLHKNGFAIPLEIHARVIFNSSGEPVSLQGVTRDITERKKAEQLLKESEERYKALHNASFGGIVIHDKGLILECNHGLSEITGYSWEELVGMDGLLLIAPETRNMVMNNILNGYEKPYEAVGIRKNGELYPLRLEARNIPYKGKTVRTVEFRDITETRQAQESLHRIEWMLSKKAAVVTSDQTPLYGDLSELNTCRLILDSVGTKLLHEIASDYLSLMETSSAIYEKNGDYALGIFASGWCRFMDQSSRELCGTDDNKKALDSGKWLCHESCWKEASLPAIESGEPVDIECQGGIHLYALPIVAGNEVIGAINFGYGDPPQNHEILTGLSEKYRVPTDELLKTAKEYQSRPYYIVETAKDRLQASANLIGEIVSRKIAEKKVLTLNEQLELKIAEKTKELQERISELERFHDATIQREFRIKDLQDEIDRLKRHKD